MCQELTFGPKRYATSMPDTSQSVGIGTAAADRMDIFRYDIEPATALSHHPPAGPVVELTPHGYFHQCRDR